MHLERESEIFPKRSPLFRGCHSKSNECYLKYNPYFLMRSWPLSRCFHQVSITLGSNPSQQTLIIERKVKKKLDGYILSACYPKIGRAEAEQTAELRSETPLWKSSTKSQKISKHSTLHGWTVSSSHRRSSCGDLVLWYIVKYKGKATSFSKGDRPTFSLLSNGPAATSTMILSPFWNSEEFLNIEAFI